VITNKDVYLYGFRMPKDWRKRWPAHARLHDRLDALSDGQPVHPGQPGPAIEPDPADAEALNAERAGIVEYVRSTLAPS
jgi:hypothetical protein